MHFATSVVVSLFALTVAAAPLDLHARQGRRLAVVRRGDEDESYGKSCRPGSSQHNSNIRIVHIMVGVMGSTKILLRYLAAQFLVFAKHTFSESRS